MIYDASGRLKHSLKPGDESLTMPPGRYLIAVAGVDGVKTDTDSFEMNKGGKVVLRVRAEPAAVVAAPPR